MEVGQQTSPESELATPENPDKDYGLIDFIKEQIQTRRQFVFEQLDDLDRHERNLSNKTIGDTLELLGEYYFDE